MSQALARLADGRSQMERCLFINDEIELPLTLLEDVNIFMELVSIQTWQTVLTDAQRRHLLRQLPTFTQNDVLEKQTTLRQLFGGQNFKFGNPLRQFHAKLKEGMFSPDIARYTALCRKAKLREYRYQQQVYYTTLLKDILVNRQRILEEVYKTPQEEPLQLKVTQYITPNPKDKILDQKIQCRYRKILREVNDECGAETSEEESDNDDTATREGRTQKQLRRLLFPDSPPEMPTTTVIPTFAPRPLPITNGQPPGNATKPRTISPIQTTDEDLKEMLRRHRKRRSEEEDHPDLDTSHLTLQDVVNRAQPQKKTANKHTPSTSGSLPPSLLKKKLKEKTEKKRKKLKAKDLEGADGPAEVAAMPGTTAPPSGELPHDESAMDGMETLEETAPVVVESGQVPGSQSASQTFGQYICFFSLLREFISLEPDSKTTTLKLEERVREWQESPSCGQSPWMSASTNWVELVAPSLKFLSGDVLGLSLENFIPLLDYKERAQHWKWIGAGRDADDQLLPLYRHWLENKDEVVTETRDSNISSPPAPKSRTNFVVRPTNSEEKEVFQEQEYIRFEQPHKAFTYQLHGYESVVGPVKGVYTKENAMNKARDHVLLVKDRPPYVTILTLVRDAAARLPNGEGTRGDICELLKDSQFLAPGVTDAQINNVVSGALDRLHYEKDPCVKYDVNRKVWIYLHRNRTEDEFERIHQAQGAAAKAKKALQKPKPPKKIKESMQAMTSLTTPKTVAVTLPESPLQVDTPSPGVTAQSPRGQSSAASPRTPQMSPRIPAQTSPKQLPAPSPKLPQTSPKLVSTSSSRLTASPKLVTANKPLTATAKTTPAAVVPLQNTAQGQVHIQGQTVSPLTLSQQLAVGKAGGNVVGGASPKPLSLTFLQPPVQAGKVGTASATPAVGTGHTVGAAPASKPLAFSLIQSHVGAKLAEGAAANTGQTRTVMLTSKGETVGQKLITLTQQQHQQLQQQQLQQQHQLQQHLQQQQLQQQQLQQQQQQQQQRQGIVASPGPAGATSMLASPKTSSPVPASSPVTMVTGTAGKGGNTKVMQQVLSTTAPHMVSVSNLGLASVATLQKQMTSSPGSTTIKIQGGSILQSQGSKPVTIQRMTSLDGADVKASQIMLQRAQSLELGDGKTTTSDPLVTTAGLVQQMTPGGAQITWSRAGGKPATLVFTKSGATLGGKPAASTATATTLSSNVQAQLIQTTALGGKPLTFSGKPFIIGGKPVHLSGKPLQLGGKPLLIGKPGGMVSALNLVTQASSGTGTVPISTLSSMPQARLITTPTATAQTLVGQILHPGGAVVQAGRSGGTTVSTSKSAVVGNVGQPKVVTTPGAGGIVVTQLTPGKPAKSVTGNPPVTHTKLVTAAAPQGSVLGHQILVTPASSPAKVVTPQHIFTGGGMRPTLLTRSPGGNASSNLQMVKTMLSQTGGKPGQTTIVLTQPGGQQVTVAGVEQLTQGGVKTVQTTAKTKAGPVYARIITPPPGIRLTAVRPGGQVPGVSVIQAVSRLPGDSQIGSQSQVTAQQAAQTVASKVADGGATGGEAQK